ncbi:thiamine diphosphokinase [Halothermothrix orenii]|uniref:Thiamine diphosphokinase n=1 Tax=Halothermothrix orenii (strain H 168 / OCM 544 / DSM 9562) TaxID=373903 RepID=B8CWU1_HALOH|nr:thiamine diphosphokinase [Halothermothrix orenii]ACL69760.1 thiamine pyrophosphokinase [Halothermothrix orenii H 168]
MGEKKAVIALNGFLTGKKEDYQKYIRDIDLVIGADGGALLLKKINVIPDLVIGDFDSLTESELNFFKKQGVTIRKYPVEKDETDGELALNYCIEKGYGIVYFIGALGGRVDQQLANIFLLEMANRYGVKAIVKEPDEEIGLINDRLLIRDKQGARFSILPLDDRVSGVSLKGFKYPLKNAILNRYKTRGISNKIVENKATVKVEKGLLMYIISEE